MLRLFSTWFSTFQHLILPDGRFRIQNTTARLPLALHRNVSHNTENHLKQIYLPCTDNHWHHRLYTMRMNDALRQFPLGESEPAFFCTAVFLFLM